MRQTAILRQGHSSHPNEHQEGNFHLRPWTILQGKQRRQGPYLKTPSQGPNQALHCSQILLAPMGQEIDHKNNIRRQLLRIGVQGIEENRRYERVIFLCYCSLKRTILMYLAVQIPEKEI